MNASQTVRKKRFLTSKSARQYVMACLVYVFCLTVNGQSLTAKEAKCDALNADRAAKVEEIAPGVFVRQGRHAQMAADNHGGIANISFVIGNKSVAVIDTGGSACDGSRLKAAIKEKTSLPVKYVINTHVHPDHMLGNAAFVEEGVEFVGHHKLLRATAERGKFYLDRFQKILGQEAFSGTKIVPPTINVKDKQTIDLGGRVLELTAHKTAHTNHDLTVIDTQTKTLWTGDLVFLGHIPVIDGRIKGWLSLLEELRKKKIERAVPGHGPASIDWPEGTDPQISYFNVLVKDIRKLIEDGAGIEEAQAKAGLSQSKLWKLFHDYNARNVSTAFSELEWE